MMWRSYCFEMSAGKTIFPGCFIGDQKVTQILWLPVMCKSVFGLIEDSIQGSEIRRLGFVLVIVFFFLVESSVIPFYLQSLKYVK